MADKGRLIEEKAVRFERVLPGPIERVWEHLTQSEHLPLWFGGSGMKYAIEGRQGGEVELGNGHVQGVVTRWEPPRLLSYTWNLSGPQGESLPESFLSFEMQAREDGDVLLTLTHRPIGAPFQPHTLMGWHTFLDLLAALLRGEELENSDEAMRRNGALYGVENPMHGPA